MPKKVVKLDSSRKALMSKEEPRIELNGLFIELEVFEDRLAISNPGKAFCWIDNASVTLTLLASLPPTMGGGQDTCALTITCNCTLF
ncbi:hypothetical protein SCG7109_BA_00080 [Chlamydiales bacterium SCGC AG-110-M15]|nr:hypothetical protein SCG7109_BA_00080 [Chlamydiales bacterium SCGC AG-110-M15]